MLTIKMIDELMDKTEKLLIGYLEFIEKSKGTNDSAMLHKVNRAFVRLSELMVLRTLYRDDKIKLLEEKIKAMEKRTNNVKRISSKTEQRKVV